MESKENDAMQESSSSLPKLTIEQRHHNAQRNSFKSKVQKTLGIEIITDIDDTDIIMDQLSNETSLAGENHHCCIIL